MRLIQGFDRFGDNWDLISKSAPESFDPCRTAASLRGRWQRLKQKDQGRPGLAVQEPEPNQQLTPLINRIDQYFRPKVGSALFAEAGALKQLEIDYMECGRAITQLRRDLSESKESLASSQLALKEAAAEKQEMQDMLAAMRRKCADYDTRTIARAKMVIYTYTDQQDADYRFETAFCVENTFFAPRAGTRLSQAS